RPLYDWYLDQVYKEGTIRPKQREFSRLNLTYTVMSKRNLLELVEKKIVDGWDDPRMPTISGLRRRGYTPASIKLFAEKVGVSKKENLIDVSLLEFCVREDLNKHAQRVMVVCNPIKVTITNYPDDKIEYIDAANNPENHDAGYRKVPFSKHIYIERDDFMENPPKKFYRLSPGSEVRLRYAYIIKCNEVIKDEFGNIVELLCTYDEQTKGGFTPEGKKVKGIIHWVSQPHAIEAEIRLYDRLFLKEDPYLTQENGSFIDNLNPDSLKITKGYCESFLKDAKPLENFQFERIGYFTLDSKYSTQQNLVFNRTVTLKDTWAKIAAGGE
ncbi:MAG: glutamate--tRNA ligase family protein, partial [Bacteroidales bacterium]